MKNTKNFNDFEKTNEKYIEDDRYYSNIPKIMNVLVNINHLLDDYTDIMRSSFHKKANVTKDFEKINSVIEQYYKELPKLEKSLKDFINKNKSVLS